MQPTHPFSYHIISLLLFWSFTITFIAMITDYIRGLWCFTSHPLDSLWFQLLFLGANSMSSKGMPSKCIACFILLSFSGPAPSLCEILRSSTKSLQALETQHHPEATLIQWGWGLLDKEILSCPTDQTILGDILSLLRGPLATDAYGGNLNNISVPPFLPVLLCLRFFYTCC